MLDATHNDPTLRLCPRSMCIPPLLMTGESAPGVWMGSAYESLLWQEDALQFRLEGSMQGRPERVLHLELSWQVEVQREPTVPGP